MVKVSIRVHSGAAQFGVSVWAESLEQAVSLVGSRYPNSNVLVKSGINAADAYRGYRNEKTEIYASGSTVGLAA